MPVLAPRRRWPWTRVCAVGQRRARPGETGILSPPHSRDRGTTGTVGLWWLLAASLGCLRVAGQRPGVVPRSEARCLQGECGARPGSFSPWCLGESCPVTPPLLRLCKRLCLALKWYESTVKYIFDYAFLGKKKKKKNCFSEDRA